MGNYINQRPNTRRRIPHGVQTLMAVAAADDQSSRRLRQESGGDGKMEDCALDSMNKLHRSERIVFKGTDHVTHQPERLTRDWAEGRAFLAGGVSSVHYD